MSTYQDRRRAQIQEIRAEKLSFIRAYKARLGCSDCGEKDPLVLELDHRDPSQKSPALLKRNIGFYHLGWQQLLQELHFVVVRCANCHRRRQRAN